MYVENADFSRGGLSRLADKVGASTSLFPMNIKPGVWQGMGGVKAKDFKEAGSNIRAAVALIKAIDERLEIDPSKSGQKNRRRVAKIGSIWNFTGRETVSKFGARVQRAFDQKLWAR